MHAPHGCSKHKQTHLQVIIPSSGPTRTVPHHCAATSPELQRPSMRGPPSLNRNRHCHRYRRRHVFPLSLHTDWNQSKFLNSGNSGIDAQTNPYQHCWSCHTCNHVVYDEIKFQWNLKHSFKNSGSSACHRYSQLWILAKWKYPGFLHRDSQVHLHIS